MKRLVSPVIFREVYAHPGEHTVKMLIDPLESPRIDHVSVEFRNSDGIPMPFAFKRWGTKLTIGFKTDEYTPDGVCVIDLTLRRIGSDRLTRERFSFWTVKE
jgi:hypothetical protein